MSRLPRLRGRQVLPALRKAGFAVVRVRGSHQFLQHADGRVTVVPIHSGEEIGRGLLSKILSDCELTPEQFATLL
jgi:predicted RNA binding protein YcfA (HicA-like mRNA interferase family)